MSEQETASVNGDCAATLQKLSRLLRQVRYSRNQDSHQSEELHRLHVGNEILSRLQHSVQADYLQALEFSRPESKNEFSALYNATMAQIDRVTSDVGHHQSSTETGFLASSSETWKNQVLEFITRLRTRPLWVADRLKSLESIEKEVHLTSAWKVPGHNQPTRSSATGRESAYGLQSCSMVNAFVFTIFAAPGACRHEDNLRLELSASIMQRLIMDDAKDSSSCQFCLATFDAWQSIFGWQGVKSFEILLMDILQSGSRILEKAEERERECTSEQAYYFSTSKRGDLEDEFFLNATRRILKFLDSDIHGGIPRGALLLSKAVCSKVSDADKARYESFILCKWFFSHFLCDAIKFPEDYYISDAHRHRILFALQSRVHSFCLPSSQSVLPKRSSIEEEIEALVISIYGSFRVAQETVSNSILAHHEPDSYQSQNLRSYSDTAIPTICLSPEDISGLFTAMFSCSQLPVQPKFGSSELSRGLSTSSTGSRLSECRTLRSSRVIFAVGSAIPDYDDCSTAQTDVDNESLPSRAEMPGDTGLSVTQDPEIEYISSLSTTLRKLTAQRLRNTNETTDEWQPLYVRDNHLTYHEPQSHEEVLAPELPDAVHTAIIHLVETFDLASIQPNLSQRAEVANFGSAVGGFTSWRDAEHRDSKTASGTSRLLQLLLDAGSICFHRHEHNLADMYYKAHDKLRRKWSSAESLDDYAPILCGIMNEQANLVENFKLRHECRSHLIAYAHERRTLLSRCVHDLTNSLRKVRLKMWYVVDIRLSKLWAQSWEVVKCLNRMGAHTSRMYGSDYTSYSLQRPSPLSRSNSKDSKDRRLPRFHRDTKQVSSNSGPTDLYTTDNLIFEAIAAPLTLGGRNKLNKGQAQQTFRWMQNHEVHNFCAGEERIHRLCFEIDDLICRLTNSRSADVESLTTRQLLSSSLWNYDLFRHEKNRFRIKRHDGIIDTNNAKLYDTEHRASLLRRGSAGDLLGTGHAATKPRGNSIGSLEKPMFRSRSHTSSSQVMESTHIDHGSFASESEPPHYRTQQSHFPLAPDPSTSRLESDSSTIRDFLLQSQISLTSLLISDFASIMYCKGSETDQWTNEELTEVASAQSCNDSRSSKMPPDDRVDAAVHCSSVLPLDLSRVKNKNLRKKHGRTQSSTMAAFFCGSTSASINFKSMPAPPSIVTNIGRDLSSIAMQRTNSTNSFFESPELPYTPSTPNRPACTSIIQYQKFPLQKAYAEILQRFSVQSSPYEKLRALYDLELLVVANMGRASNDWDPHRALPPSMPESPMVQTHKNSIISAETLQRYDPSDPQDLARLRLETLNISKKPSIELLPSNSGKLSNGFKSPGTDKIVEELQRLLRDPEIRPKTLFRDLQYIASFIPANILNMTDEGKVFWDVGLAALAVKREMTEAITKYASAIVRPATELSQSTVQPNNHDGSMTDAVKLFAIAAKERDPAAMRQLAILQMQRPELVEIILPPLSDPSAIFATPANTSTFKYPGIRRVSPPSRNTSADNESRRVAKLGAATVWLKLAAAEGDQIAETMLLTLSA